GVSQPIAYTLTVGDFNNDGKQDMAVISYGNGSAVIAILLGNGDGTFSQSAQYSVVEFDALLGADLNNDGNLDLVVPDPNIGVGVAVLLGNGDGTFQPPILSQPNSPVYGGFFLADFNGDGALDLLAAQGSVCMLLGNGDGSFQPQTCTLLPQGFNYP